MALTREPVTEWFMRRQKDPQLLSLRLCKWQGQKLGIIASDDDVGVAVGIYGF